MPSTSKRIYKFSVYAYIYRMYTTLFTSLYIAIVRARKKSVLIVFGRQALHITVRTLYIGKRLRIQHLIVYEYTYIQYVLWLFYLPWALSFIYIISFFFHFAFIKPDVSSTLFSISMFFLLSIIYFVYE